MSPGLGSSRARQVVERVRALESLAMGRDLIGMIAT
jgi:hypothetical protein